MKRFCIGIAGYMGSGKTTCCRSFAGLDEYVVVDGDKEARSIMLNTPSLHCLLEQSFGSAVIENGNVSFKKLGSIVFGDLMELRKLNAIIHPLLLDRLRKTIFELESRIVVLDAALLPIWNIDDLLDLRIWIDASFDTRFTRLSRKSPGLQEEEIRLRMLQQQSLFAPPPEVNWTYIANEGDSETIGAVVLSCVRQFVEGKQQAGIITGGNE